MDLSRSGAPAAEPEAAAARDATVTALRSLDRKALLAVTLDVLDRVGAAPFAAALAASSSRTDWLGRLAAIDPTDGPWAFVDIMHRVRVQAVCKFWKQYLRETPELYRDLWYPCRLDNCVICSEPWGAERQDRVLSNLLRKLPQGARVLSLDLEHLWVSSYGLQRIATTCPSLRALRLRDGHSRQLILDDGLLAIANGCRDLRVLDVKRCFSVGTAGIFAIANSCKSLTTLNIDECHDVKGFESFEATGTYLPSLTDLDASDINFSDASLKVIADGSPKLRKLSLYFQDDILEDHGLTNEEEWKTFISTTDAGLIPVLRACPSLISLNLEGNVFLTDAALEAIGMHCSALTYVNVAGCRKITAAGVRAILPAFDSKASCRLVTHSRYHFPPIDVAGIMWLMAAYPWVTIGLPALKKPGAPAYPRPEDCSSWIWKAGPMEY